MKTRWYLLLLLPLLAVFTASCNGFSPGSPPGWRSPVSELFVDESAFPNGWRVDFPEDTVTDPTVNHVSRTWGRPDVSGTVAQTIWRAYTITEAHERFTQLCASEFQPTAPLYPGTIFVPFEPPPESHFSSPTADEFYLVCGWWGESYCEVIARYHNYVTVMSLDREDKREGQVTHGLTYAEIETVIRAMDAKFVAAMETFHGSPGR